MEWWVWLLLIIVVVLILLAIWWWWRQTQQRQDLQRQSSAPPITAPRMAATPTPVPPAAPAPTSMEHQEALPAPALPEANDLAAIEGIGPRIHDILNEAGIKTFAQLADTPVDRIRDILAAAEFKAPTNPSTWPAQARLAADSKWQELKELQDSLKAGR